jgi:hypothetical protein
MEKEIICSYCHKSFIPKNEYELPHHTIYWHKCNETTYAPTYKYETAYPKSTTPFKHKIKEINAYKNQISITKKE